MHLPLQKIWKILYVQYAKQETKLAAKVRIQLSFSEILDSWTVNGLSGASSLETKNQKYTRMVEHMIISYIHSKRAITEKCG